MFTVCPVPECGAIGRFKMHGSYFRHALYFFKGKIIHEYMEIKRIRCKSCKTTHAVMPRDIIPYKTITLFILICILALFYVKGVSVLTIEKAQSFSFQYIYTVINTFKTHENNIRQYIRERFPESTPPDFNENYIINLIRKPHIRFQFFYIKMNHQPCFMCKFFDRKGTPPVGIYVPAGTAT
jgi:hypothetical protein